MSTAPEPAVPAFDPDRVRIFDTTLRDGEQSPGASMNMAEKLEVARALARSGGRHHRGRVSRSPRSATSRRSGPLPPRSPARSVCGLARCNDTRHRPRLGGDPVRPEAADPRLPGHLGHPPRAQAADDHGPDHREGRRQRAPGQELLPGHRVQPRGRRPDRARLPLRGRRGGHRGRRDHGQHPRHRRLCHAHSSTRP